MQLSRAPKYFVSCLVFIFCLAASASASSFSVSAYEYGYVFVDHVPPQVYGPYNLSDPHSISSGWRLASSSDVGNGITAGSVFGSVGQLHAFSQSTANGQSQSGSELDLQFFDTITVNALPNLGQQPLGQIVLVGYDMFIDSVLTQIINPDRLNVFQGTLTGSIGGCNFRYLPLTGGQQSQGGTCGVELGEATPITLKLSIRNDVYAFDGHSGTAIIDASNTGYVVLDAPTGFDITSASGYDYTHPPVESVPEPSSILLMGMGIASAEVVRRITTNPKLPGTTIEVN